MQAIHSHECKGFLTRRKANRSHLQILFLGIVSAGSSDIIVPGSEFFQLLVSHISKRTVLQKVFQARVDVQIMSHPLLDVSKSLASIIWDISRALNPCVYRALTVLFPHITIPPSLCQRPRRIISIAEGGSGEQQIGVEVYKIVSSET